MITAGTLKRPLTILGIIGSTHFAAEAIWDGLADSITPPVVAPILLSLGAWQGVLVVRAGRGLAQVTLAGLGLGVLALGFDTMGFGVLLDRGLEAGWLSGLFGLLMLLWGALIGGGIALSLERAPTR